MKRTLMILLLVSAPAWTQDMDFCPVPYFSFLDYIPSIFAEDLIKIEKIDYERNSDATFCKRTLEMIDTIVLHHSETSSLSTPEEINELHLNRSSFKTDQGKVVKDPWYMIGYNYVVNSPYPGNRNPSPVVTEGRPLNLVGSHAGSFAFVPLSPVQKKLWDDGKIVCGKEGGEFKVDPNMMSNGKIKANITTVGLVVVGNYSPKSSKNPHGYSRSSVRNPSEKTLDMVARLSCQLQLQNPSIKNIKWHNYYHDTSCPGNLKNFIGQIKALARRYGCEFY